MVLALTAAGHASPELGKRRSISSKTVDTYRGRIVQKLGLNHRSELVPLAFHVGLLWKP